MDEHEPPSSMVLALKLRIVALSDANAELTREVAALKGQLITVKQEVLRIKRRRVCPHCGKRVGAESRGKRKP